MPTRGGWEKIPDAEWIALCEACGAEADRLGKHEISQELRELIAQIRVRGGSAVREELTTIRGPLEQGDALEPSSGSSMFRTATAGAPPVHRDDIGTSPRTPEKKVGDTSETSRAQWTEK